MKLKAKLSKKFKILCIFILVIGVGVSIQQIAYYLIPPAKGKQCQQNLGQAESSAQLIPETEKSSLSSYPQMVSLPPALKTYARSGFGIASAADPVVWSALLGTGWYLDWDVQPISSKRVPNHWQMVRLKPGCIYPSEAYIRWAARRYPGNVWVIGNEPDVALQDNLAPEEYAEDYHELYALIKKTDHTAQIAVAGVAQATPIRLEYLNSILKYYKNKFDEPLPADWWTLHGYVLQEKRDSWGVGVPQGISTDSGKLYSIEDHGNLAIFKEQIIDFRTWMAENGYRETPLALTEFGILLPDSYGYSQYSVSKYLNYSMAWLVSAKNDQIGLPADDNRLVQRWAWFSLSDPTYSNSNLAVLDTGGLTLVGQAYRNFNETAGK